MIKLCAFADEASPMLEGQIAALKRNGVSLIELRGINGTNILQISEDDAKIYKKQLSDADITVWSIGSPLGKVDIGCDLAEYEEKIRHICRLANIFGTDKIRMFSFFNAYDSADAVKAALARMVEIGKEYGVYMYHENEKAIYGDIPARVVELLDAVDGMKSIFDPANYVETGADLNEALDLLHARTDYFHIKDCIRESGEIVPAGYGDGCIRKLVEMIGDRDAVLTVEPHLAIFSGYSDIDATEMKNKFSFASNDEAFDAAVNAIKAIVNA